MTALEITGVVIGAIIVWLVVVVRIIRKQWHFPAPAFIGRFLDIPQRRLMQPPSKLIERSGIKQGMRVLDLGCGSGAFTTYVARAVGEKGKVYALDVQPAMLKQLKRKLAKEQNRDIKNVELKLADAYALPFEDSSLDVVYMAAVFMEIPHRPRALKEIWRVLKPGAFLAITEFMPDPDYPWRSTIIKICQKEGYTLDANLGNLWNYTLRFKKPS